MVRYAGGQHRPSMAITMTRRRRELLNSSFVFVHVPKTGGTSIRAAFGLLRTPYHLTAREMRQTHAEETAGKFSFAFVRNPWDRFVSYNHSIAAEWKPPDPMVGFVLDDDGKPLVDFIGRFENLAADFRTICDRVGIAAPELPHLNASEHQHYREHFDDASRHFVATRYARDIEAFGYAF